MAAKDTQVETPKDVEPKKAPAKKPASKPKSVQAESSGKIPYDHAKAEKDLESHAAYESKISKGNK